MTSGASREQIDAEEALLGARLPAGLRKRLESENGGNLWTHAGRWTLYPVWDPTTRVTARRTTDHIARQTSALREAFGDLFPEGAIAVAENEFGDPLLILNHETPVTWHKDSGALEALDLDWERTKSERIASNTLDWLVDLLSVDHPGTRIAIHAPGTPFQVSFLFADQTVVAEAVGLASLSTLQRHHIGTTMVRALTALGWAPMDPTGEKGWTRSWLKGEWDPRKAGRLVASTFDQAYGLDAQFLRIA